MRRTPPYPIGRARCCRTMLVAAMLTAVGACSTTDWQARAVSMPAGANVQDAALPAYKRGKTHLMAGNFGLALEAFRQARRAEPDSVAVLNAVAITYGKLGRLDVARRYFERALAIDPAPAATLNNFGRALLEHDRAREALRLFDRALERAPDHPTIAANAASARGRIAEQRAALAAAGPARVEASRGPWIERSSSRLQTLVTSSLAPAGGRMADPKVVNVFGAKAPVGEAASVERRTPGARESAPPRSARPRIEVSNGAGRRHMAARMRHHLSAHGLQVDSLTNADSFGHRRSAIFYRPGFEASAAELARALPFAPVLEEDPGQWSAVRLRLGADLLEFDATLPRQA